jgi:hypothetical protein
MLWRSIGTRRVGNWLPSNIHLQYGTLPQFFGASFTYLDPVSAKGERTSAALALEKAREIIFIFNISVSRETASRETFR